MPVSKIIGLAPTAAALALVGAPTPAAGQDRVQIVVGDVRFTTGMTRDRTYAIAFLRQQLGLFLAQVPPVKGVVPKPIIIPVKTEFSAHDIDDLRTEWGRETKVLAYVWGLGSRQQGSDVLSLNVFIGDLGPPKQYNSALVVFREWRSDAYQSVFIIAYALMIKAYTARQFDSAIAVAKGVTDYYRIHVATSDSASSDCVSKLHTAIGILRKKAEVARQSNARVVPPSFALTDPLPCN